MWLHWFIAASERIGWIPLEDEVPGNLVDEYRWIFGLSVTEMEIVHGAYRKDNPNCELFTLSPVRYNPVILLSIQAVHNYFANYMI